MRCQSWRPRAASAASIAVAVLSLSAGGAAAATGGTNAIPPPGRTPAPASAGCRAPGPPVPSGDCALAGYQASGRDFRYAQAVITIPDHHGVAGVCPPGDVVCPTTGRPGTTHAATARRGARRGTPTLAGADPQIYVALDGSPPAGHRFARAGLRPCAGGPPCGSSGWEAFAQVAVPGAAPVSARYPIPASAEGDGVFASVYLQPDGRLVHTVLTLPDGSTFNDYFTVRGPVYTRAQALAGWTAAAARPRPVPAARGKPGKVRETQFRQGRFTTVNGQQGTFWGPWAVRAVEATSNGDLPPAGTLIAQPSYLWNDGTSFGGRFGDAFGVWRFPF